MVEWMSRQANVRMDGRVDCWTDRWMDGRVDGGWMG